MKIKDFRGLLILKVNSRLKSTHNNLRIQLQKLLPILVIIYIPAVCVLGGLLIMHWLIGLELSYVTGDTHAVFYEIIRDIQQQTPEVSLVRLKSLHLPIYTGFISNIGFLLWCSTTAICFFVCILVAKKPKLNLSSSFFFWSASLSGILLLDDLFLIHEHIGPIYLGINEKIIFIFYGLSILTYFLRWQRQILKTEYLLLLLALIFFALSLLLDLNYPHLDGFLEDSFKFLGILTWSCYYIRTCGIQIGLCMKVL